MVKGVEVGDILKALPVEARAEFAEKLKREGGVEVAFTVASKGRKRKHRWGNVEGRAVAVRFTESEYELVSRRAAARGLSPGLYLKWLATRVHSRGLV